MSCCNVVFCSLCCIDGYQVFIYILSGISYFALNILVALIRFDVVNYLLFSFV